MKSKQESFIFRVPVTVIQRIHFTKSNMAYVSVEKVIEIMRKGDFALHDNQYGDYTLRQAVEYIRSLNTHAEQQQWKARLLPAVAYNGMFLEVNNKGLTCYSNITAMDFDDIRYTERKGTEGFGSSRQHRPGNAWRLVQPVIG